MRESGEGAGCRSSEMQKKVWSGVKERWGERSVDSAGLSIIWMQEKESLSLPLVNDHILSLFSSAPPLPWLCHLYCAAYYGVKNSIKYIYKLYLKKWNDVKSVYMEGTKPNAVM